MPTPRRHAAPLLAALPLLLLLLPAAAAQPEASRDKDNGGGAGVGGGGYRPTQPPSFSAPMAVLLAALIAAFFLIGFFSIYMRQCGRGAASAGPDIPAAALLALARQEEQRQMQQQRGLDPAVVASFPTMRYAEARELRVGGKDAALECAVCLSEFADDEELRLLPPCSHAFHPDCIGEWLAGHVTCPVCRCSLDPDEVAAGDANGNTSGEVGGEQQQQPQDQVAVDVDRECTEEDDEERRKEAMELERIGSQRRAVRSRSGRPSLVARSHSTGHSLAARLDGDLERFTLRLPEHMRRSMVAAGEESLRRTGAREARGGGGGGGGGARSARLGRSDRWPSFISRTFSARVSFWAASRRAPDAEAAAAGAEAVSTPRAAAAAARAKREKASSVTADGAAGSTRGSVRFDCLGGIAGGGGAGSGGARVGAAAGDSETEDEEKAIVRQV
ncbi:hypothetical protein ACP70R_041603 [Stipagrostis hirtigluma subsp. patula]